MCGGRIDVSAPLQTRVAVATEFVVIGDLIGPGEAQGWTVLSVRRRTAQPSWVDAVALQFDFNRVKDEFGRHHCKGCPEDDRSARRRVSNGEIYLHEFL